MNSRRVLTVLLALLALAGMARAQTGADRRIIVRLAAASAVTAAPDGQAFTTASLRAWAGQWRVERIASILPAAPGVQKAAGGLDRIVIITLAPGIDATAAIADLGSRSDVDWAEADHLLHVDLAPDDSAWSAQWGMRRVGMEQAWERTRGSASVRIGIIDTGVDYLHPDLAGQLWIDSEEDINHNGRFDPWPATEARNGITGDLDGIDNDANGFVDDVIGYDFVDQQGEASSPGGDHQDPDPDPMDEMGHGTSVAGIIGAATNNTIGVAGIADGCRMMTLRAFDARGIGAESDVARALAYAVANGARVINMSFGDVVYSRLLRDVIRWAAERGVTMVASAGNSQSRELHYPSAFDETISVSATTSGDGLAGFSNWGQTITIAAPGVDIITTERNGRYTSFNGTSASAPFVSGVAALILSLHPEFTPEEVRGILISTAADLGTQGWDERFGAGLVQAHRALALAHPTEVRIITPSTDAAISGREIVVVGTAASPFMTGWTLSRGVGVDPRSWTTLRAFTPGQVIADTLLTWDVSTLRDTVYTLRLSAQSDKGTTLEHRVVIRIDHTAPVFLGVAFVPAIDGRHHGVMAGFVSDEPTVGRLWYRIKNGGSDWSWVSMESGTVNNLFVSTVHAVFLGRTELVPGQTYELQITAENEAGLVSTVKDGGRYWELTVPQPVPETGFQRRPWSLPAGRLTHLVTDFNANGRPEILFNDYSGANLMRAMERGVADFNDVASGALADRIVRGVGDVDGDGLADILCSYVRKGYLLRSSAPGHFPDRLFWADTTSPMFWPVTIADVDKDGRNEVLAVTTDSTIGVYAWNGTTLARTAVITNPTKPPRDGGNVFSAPRVAIGDFNGNTVPDLLFGDDDGDFFIVESTGSGSFRTIWKSENDFIGGSDLVAGGDFNGDGRDEFAIGFHTADDDVIPFWFFAIVRLNSNNESSILWSQNFQGVEESGKIGYFANVQNSLSVVQADADAARELMIATFPELTMIRYDAASKTFGPAWHQPMANTSAVACADFDRDGVNELAFVSGDSLVFFGAVTPATGPAPVREILARYATPASVRMEWTVATPAPQYRVYKGRDRASLAFFGGFTSTSFTDPIVPGSEPFLYAVTAVDSSRSPMESEALVSRLFTPHDQPVIDSTAWCGRGQVRLHSSQVLSTAIPPTSAFLLDGGRQPESVALLDTRTLLLSFGTVPDGMHAITLTDYRDAEGIPFDPSALISVEARTTDEPHFFIERIEYLGEKRITVHFNRPLPQVSADLSMHFTFEPDGAVVSARVDSLDPRIVHLVIASARPIGALGVEYIITATGLISADGIAIVTGAGGTAGVIINQVDLSEVFVYPNPLRPSDGQDFVTFANLTQRATVRIYSPSGVFIREVTSTQGTGGVQWDLKNEQGTRVPEGMYLFHVTGTNAQGAEVTPVKGKFAILR